MADDQPFYGLADINSREGTAASYAAGAFNSIWKRTPTPGELALAIPQYLGGDPNQIDYVTGNAYVATLKPAVDQNARQAAEAESAADLAVANQLKQKAESGSLVGMMGFGSVRTPDAGVLQPSGGAPASVGTKRPASVALAACVVIALLIFFGKKA